MVCVLRCILLKLICATNPPRRHSHQGQQCDQTPPVRSPIVLQSRQKWPQAEIHSPEPEKRNSSHRANAAPPRSPRNSCRTRSRRDRQPVKNRLMVRQPRHPRIRRRLDERSVGVRQKSQQAIEGRQNKIRSRKQPQPCVDPQPQNCHTLEGNTNPAEFISGLRPLSFNDLLPESQVTVASRIRRDLLQRLSGDQSTSLVNSSVRGICGSDHAPIS